MNNLNIVALAGGVGGAKLATGLQAALEPGRLSVVVNTADDFEHWGLYICPDLDTVLYNLAGVNNPETGWGRSAESFTTLDTMSQLGGEEWFRLGDKDLAVHLRRTEWLRQGILLTDVADRLRRSFGIPSQILPMCDQAVRTLMHTDEGDLPFQHYFVRRRCEPVVMDMTFVGAPAAKLTDALLATLDVADVILFCPSNPYLSIDPILSIPGLRRQLRASPAPKIAVSPIVGGRAIKGPAAKLMRELGVEISPITVVQHFDGLLDGFVLDEVDANLCDEIDLPVLATNTIMSDLASKTQLAQQVLDFAAQLRATQPAPAQHRTVRRTQ